MSVAVLIPTLRRPESLERTLRSIFAHERLTDLVVEIVVADNSPEGSARPVVDRLRPLSAVPLRYVQAPTPGVATVRNAGLAGITADHVAFIDDDETAQPGWLAALHSAHVASGADVTFGPVHGRAPDARPDERAHVERFFSRLRPELTGLISDTNGCGCGNSMMRRATALAGPAPFDTGADLIGGEDDRLFTRVAAAGGRFGWAAEAAVDEHVPPPRATARYVLKRAMAMGQGPPRIRLRRDPPDRLGAAGWMMVGIAQLLGHGAAALALKLAGRPAWLAQADRAARGLGKVVFWPELAFYGAGAASVDRPSVALSPSARGSASLVSSATKMTQVKSL